MNNLKLFDTAQRNENVKNIAGVDEAGRGPLAEPVVAAAVIFKEETIIEGINDSKKLNPSKREKLSEMIKDKALTYAFGIVDHLTIDNINILKATLKAMKISVENLDFVPDLILIDGNKSFNSNQKIKTIVKGDTKSFSIAAASILAKVRRDEIMREAALAYPQYNWQSNKGYGTLEHINAIKQYGMTEFHRKSFLGKILTEEIQEKFI